MRSGFGTRHPGLIPILAREVPASTDDNGSVLTAAYLGSTELPDELITSVRCLVRVGTDVIVCTNADGVAHPWPGGKREPGETFAQTAVREVHEETGWRLRPDSLRRLGWLHFQHLRSVADDYPFPHPDFCQLVLTGSAVSRDVAPDDDWTDPDGYELESRLLTVADAIAATAAEPGAAVFLRLLGQ
jgi:ADP-ribose pyrophosphatase YjhB (NUDIX family)